MSILQTSEGVKLFEKKEETIPSPPSAVQRETIIDPVDPVAPVDDSQRHGSRRERPTWARQTLLEAEGHATPRDTFRESKRPQIFSSYVQL
jgi:hypothetical protein